MYKKQILYWPTTFRWMEKIVLKLQDFKLKKQQNLND